jgi:UDPglucose 6-dehydrogenase
VGGSVETLSAADGADAMVLITEWDQFRALDIDRIKGLMRQPVMVDLRNVYRPAEMRARGFRYASIGRA